MKAIIRILVHAFLGWILCAATMGICMALTTASSALYIHAALAPVIFFAVSLHYFKKHNHKSPLIIASAFVAFVVFMDFFVVAYLILRSFEMFTSLLGTWIPFVLIFTSTFITGTFINRKRRIAP